MFVFLVGFFYGGKIWCNYFCLMVVIQGIYIGFGGLLDFKVYIQKFFFVQFVCWMFRQGMDQSICVGCILNCLDVDLENLYWKLVDFDQKCFVYYGFFGFVFVFYIYYFVYLGGWFYYMIGVWMYEDNQFGKFLSFGFYFDGYVVLILKLFVVLFYFVVCIVLFYLFFFVIEVVYVVIVQVWGFLIFKICCCYYMLIVSVFLSFNFFYVFVGWFNIFLMLLWVIKLIDMIIVFVLVMWMI